MQQKTMQIHDVCLSEDERQLSCVGANYLLIYSMQKLEKKAAKNIFTFYKANIETDQLEVAEPKEVLYLGVETNLTHCSYLIHNVLTVAGTVKL